jgi:tRNA-dihydrouridine synthase A
MALPSRRLSIAPMMAVTDRHFRYFLRLLSKQTWLYTEMVVDQALIHGDKQRFLRYDDSEHPIALQLGGSNPSQLAQCTKWAEEWGYDEVNLNVGCPSDRVQSGQIGACLMAVPQIVADAVHAMQSQVKIPVTVKSRIGIDDKDSFEELCSFIETIAQTGCKTFIIHARKAWLKGLSPKENRHKPPICWSVVHQVKQVFPHLEIIINGDIKSLEQGLVHLDDYEGLPAVDGVMLGRLIMDDPWALHCADSLYYGLSDPTDDLHEVLALYEPYLVQAMSEGVPFGLMVQHLLALFHGQRGAKQWRRYLTAEMYQEGAGIEVLRQAKKLVGELPIYQL